MAFNAVVACFPNNNNENRPRSELNDLSSFSLDIKTFIVAELIWGRRLFIKFNAT